ncbi:RtcB family protein [Catenulispora subtropica]|uniref:RtcB family protein n=1 Tax=Catenulispora subtropica TaxID=450798 RepID=UPI0031DD22E7
MDLIEETPYRWRIEPHDGMRVPGVVFASRHLLPDAPGDLALDQVASVAMLPGIVQASYAMPDVHWGYGFPIGGVAATDPAAGGVVSPGGVGFDISCGVRLLVADATREQLSAHFEALMDAADTLIPRGVGPGGVLRDCSEQVLQEILRTGSVYAVEHGYGQPGDLTFCEDHGAVADADPAQVSDRARERGRRQVGSIGSSNHFWELQIVDRVLDRDTAEAYGLAPDTVCVMIHCGSRGLGHQICTDQLRTMVEVMPGYGITVPDQQLACVPVDSEHGRRYLGAMAAAANYGRANRQLLTHATRLAFARAGLGDLRLLYDVSHNLAKMETHHLGGEPRELCIHRKGATRAFGPGDPDLPEALRPQGQPVLVPGSMGTASWVLAGVPNAPAFASACHGAGRVLSRHAVARRVKGTALRHDLAHAGITVRGASPRSLAEEAPMAYKDVDEVVEVCHRAGLARPVARLIPLGVIKG